MSPEVKIPYIPSVRKRFEISSDPYSRERIKAIKDTYQSLTASIPGVSIGFSLFGSLSKGKYLEESTAPVADIDLAVFVDTDDTMIHYPDIMRSNDRFRYNSELASSLYPSERGSLSVPRFTMFQYVHRFVSSRLPYLNDRRPIGLNISTREITLAGEGSIMDIFNKHIKKPDDLGTQYHLANFFHLDIGGGLKKYRQEFVKAFSEVNDIDTKWQTLRNVVLDFEKRQDAPEDMKHHFPKTYEEAVVYYCVKT